MNQHLCFPSSPSFPSFLPFYQYCLGLFEDGLRSETLRVLGSGGEVEKKQRLWTPPSASSFLRSARCWVTWCWQGGTGIAAGVPTPPLALLPCLAGWKLLVCRVNLQITHCVNALRSWEQTASPCSRALQLGITGFVCVFSGKGKLTSWMNPKEWGGWQSLYMCWGLIWL